MSDTVTGLFRFENTFADQLPGLFEPWRGDVVAEPRILVLQRDLAAELGLDPDALDSPDGAAAFTGSVTLHGSTPIAQAYAGHQFGGFSPRLGDGRALLLGEIIDIAGRRRDIHLKGSGRTPFSRGGDGKAAVGPMMREYIIGEAMHGLGIPTTRALAVIATGDNVMRERPLPGAVLTRVAASHLRVGTFQYASNSGDLVLLRRLADYSIARHYPAAADAPNPYLAFFAGVTEAQASLVAKWMNVGFIHGVMNTDNTTISGETIDFGPCAFMDSYDPATVFSSIDHGGRYAFASQPRIVQWNLARLAETLIPLVDDEVDVAVAALMETVNGFAGLFLNAWRNGMKAKLGIVGHDDLDTTLINELHELLHRDRVDYTIFYRAMSSVVRGDAERVRELFVSLAEVDAWLDRCRTRRAADGRSANEVADAMDLVNPLYIARNHIVEAALTAATAGDMQPTEDLVALLRHPFTEQPNCERYGQPDPDAAPYQTFCGT